MRPELNGMRPELVEGRSCMPLVAVADGFALRSERGRNRSRKASIRQTGACGPGFRPSRQPHEEIRFSTDRS